MHYLTELANKLVATYRDGKGSGAAFTEEERRNLVAAIRCALELETGKRMRDEPSADPIPEYELSGAAAFSSSAMADKEEA